MLQPSCLWNGACTRNTIAVKSGPDLIVGIHAGRYAFSYSGAADSTKFLVLLTAVIIGKAATAWVQSSGNSNSRSLAQMKVICLGLLFILGALALWQPELGPGFKYPGVPRWSGAWLIAPATAQSGATHQSCASWKTPAPRASMCSTSCAAANSSGCSNG